MRRTILSVAILLLGAPLRAQDPLDTLSAVSWQRDEVAVGVQLIRRQFDELFGAPQSVVILEVGPGVRFDLAAAERRTRTSVLASRATALAAVNGGFFIVGTGEPVGLLRIDDELLSPATEGQGSFGVDDRGRIEVAAIPAGDWHGKVTALGAGPILVRAGKVVDHGERQRAIRHPRTALGVRRDGSVLLIVVDGRNGKAAGMSFEELATVLVSLDCRDAVNLDGGGSSTMWIQGPGIVNHPSDNKRFDAAGERAVANAVLLFAPAVLVLDEEVAQLGAFELLETDDGWRGDCAVSTGDGPATATWSITAPRPGRYTVFARWPRISGARPGKVAVRAEGLDATFDQRSRAGRWNPLGEVELGADPFEISWVGEDGRTLLVDGLRLVEIQ